MREPFDLDAPHKYLIRLGPTGPYVLTRRFGVPTYDFDFETQPGCSHPVYLPDEITCIARISLIADYADVHERLRMQGLRLVNDPVQSRRANDLAMWSPLLSELTPRSIVFEGEVDVARVERELGYPLFVKTVQQTHGHLRALAFVDDRDDGQLIVIETNDAQESGYTTIDPEALWREVIARDTHRV